MQERGKLFIAASRIVQHLTEKRAIVAKPGGRDLGAVILALGWTDCPRSQVNKSRARVEHPLLGIPLRRTARMTAIGTGEILNRRNRLCAGDTIGGGRFLDSD